MLWRVELVELLFLYGGWLSLLSAATYRRRQLLVRGFLPVFFEQRATALIAIYGITLLSVPTVATSFLIEGSHPMSHRIPGLTPGLINAQQCVQSEHFFREHLTASSPRDA